MNDTLKSQLVAELGKVWGSDQKMIDFCLKETSEAVRVAGGIVVFEKPRIQKDFCFGYGCNGVSVPGDYEAAAAAEHYADTHEDYFYRENLKGYDEQIEALKQDKLVPAAVQNYYQTTKILKLRFYTYYEMESELHQKYLVHVLKDAEKKVILKALASERAKFEKRLKTYIKRYGLSKLHTWTYLSD